MATGAAFWPTQQHCLDAAFDAPDAVADEELCRVIAAGKAGLHPDAWGNHDPLTLLPPRFRRWEPLTPHRMIPILGPDPVPVWRAEYRRPPVPKRKPGRPRKSPQPQPARSRLPQHPWERQTGGTIELTCDECGEAFGPRVDYDIGQREAMAAGLRAMGRQEGWTHIDGRDRCPDCSPIAPEDVSNGAGERQGNKQYTNGG